MCKRTVRWFVGGVLYRSWCDLYILDVVWMLEEGAFGGGLGEMYRLGGWFVHFERVRVVKDLLGFVGR